MKLSEKILYYRKAAKLSQEELAARVGVSRQAVSKWELADAVPEVDKLLALARAFGVTVDELLSESAPGASQERGGQPEKEAPPAERRTEDGRNLGRRLGGLVRKFGWLAGVYVSLYGLGITVVGGLARWGFQRVLFEGPLGLREELLGHAAVSRVGDMGGFALGFANVIILIGAVVTAAGILLAVVLYRMGNKKD